MTSLVDSKGTNLKRFKRIPWKAVPLALVLSWATTTVRSQSDHRDKGPGTERWEAPARAAARANPVLANSSSIDRGKELYLQECAACHGSTGNGDGAKVKDLNVTPSDLSKPTVQRQSDGALFWKISEGKTPMLPFRLRFSEHERWMIVNYLRTLSVRPTGRVVAAKSATEVDAATASQTQSSIASASRASPQATGESNEVAAGQSSTAGGKELYMRECADCHGRGGKGDGPKASEQKVNPTDLSSPAVQQQGDRVLFSKITEGKRPMPAFKAILQEPEVWMVIRYLRTFGTPQASDTPLRSLSQKPHNPLNSRACSQTAYLHVLVNPMPIYGLPLAALALLAGMLLRNRPMQSLGLCLVFLCAASAWLAYFLGHKAYHEIYLMIDSEGQRWLDSHMHRADKVIYLFYALASTALAAALVPCRVPKMRLPLEILTLTLTLICMTGSAWIAKAGGKVRHEEFRGRGLSPPTSGETPHSAARSQGR